jgi:hypothetical protein
LISAAFLASDFLQDVEVPKLFRRREEGGLRVIPVLLRSCHWDALLFALFVEAEREIVGAGLRPRVQLVLRARGQSEACDAAVGAGAAALGA